MAYHSNAAPLSISEGVLLGHAMVARVAENQGIRVFFIKGPASVLLGLRNPKVSADVDVFLAPDKLEPLVRGLRKRGWRIRPVDPDNKTFPKHGVILDHAEWPCCIDIHIRFPGMEKAASDCFELMWGFTELVDLAGQVIRVPSRPLGILLLVLHALRSPHVPERRQELEFLAGLTERESLARILLEIASSTGALAAMRPFLADLLPESEAPEWPRPSLEWCNRLLAREPGSARIVAIAQASWRDRPKMLWRAVFPSPETFLSRNIYADMSLGGRLSQHRARWTRFLLALPRLARDLRTGG